MLLYGLRVTSLNCVNCGTMQIICSSNQSIHQPRLAYGDEVLEWQEQKKDEDTTTRTSCRMVLMSSFLQARKLFHCSLACCSAACDKRQCHANCSMRVLVSRPACQVTEIAAVIGKDTVLERGITPDTIASDHHQCSSHDTCRLAQASTGLGLVICCGLMRRDGGVDSGFSGRMTAVCSGVSGGGRGGGRCAGAEGPDEPEDARAGLQVVHVGGTHCSLCTTSQWSQLIWHGTGMLYAGSFSLAAGRQAGLRSHKRCTWTVSGLGWAGTAPPQTPRQTRRCQLLRRCRALVTRHPAFAAALHAARLPRCWCRRRLCPSPEHKYTARNMPRRYVKEAQNALMSSWCYACINDCRAFLNHLMTLFSLDATHAHLASSCVHSPGSHGKLLRGRGVPVCIR